MGKIRELVGNGTSWVTPISRGIGKKFNREILSDKKFFSCLVEDFLDITSINKRDKKVIMIDNFVIEVVGICYIGLFLWKRI
jgi:hypothetical protein